MGDVTNSPKNLAVVESVKLYPYLQVKFLLVLHHIIINHAFQEYYSESFINNICMIKIDTEGYDVVILEDLDPRLRPPIMWIEWFVIYKFYKYDRKKQEYIYEVKYIFKLELANE